MITDHDHTYDDTIHTMRLYLNELFQFVLAVSSRHNIDESHSIGHSMRVFQFAEQIAREESRWVHNPATLIDNRDVIHAAAILHDTCDKKYRDESVALSELREFLLPKMTEEKVNATLDIIGTMSYSTVKKHGMPKLGKYQTAYNVVREADLLDAYDFDRSMIYHMSKNGKSLEESYLDACKLFEDRVLRHHEDGLFFTRYALREHKILAQNAIVRMHYWRRVLKPVG